MTPFIVVIAIASLFFLAPLPSAFAVSTRADGEETARLLAALLDAGRMVIEHNQAMIDDPRRGNKGFTPEVFERQLIEEFRLRTGIDMARLKSLEQEPQLPGLARELLPALIQASKEVVTEAQIVINQRGIGYKNFIPATFGSQAASRFSKRTQVTLKQTALNPRNPKNEPDPYEAAILRRLSTQKQAGTTSSEVTEGNGGVLTDPWKTGLRQSSVDEGQGGVQTLRVLMPIYYTTGCLICHGMPAHELDIAGYPKEGAQEGELAGAISVTIPLERSTRR
jgi:general secretion pathway protein A